jgi:hypothetical protein
MALGAACVQGFVDVLFRQVGGESDMPRNLSATLLSELGQVGWSI